MSKHRMQIVRIYFETHGLVRKSYRALRPFCSRHNSPFKTLIRLNMNGFLITHTLIENPHWKKRCTVCTQEIIDVEGIVEDTIIGYVSNHFFEDFAKKL